MGSVSRNSSSSSSNTLLTPATVQVGTHGAQVIVLQVVDASKHYKQKHWQSEQINLVGTDCKLLPVSTVQ
jgi:hypothetical protein